MLDISPEDFAQWLESQAGREFACRDACHCPVASYLKEAKGWKRPSVVCNSSANLAGNIDCVLNPEWVQRFVREVDSGPMSVSAQSAAAIVRRVAQEGSSNNA